MAELANPLFENEREFLERQKLEYERALLGDVDQIKTTTRDAGKKVLIGAGVAGGLWLLVKAFRKKPAGEKEIRRLKSKARKKPTRRVAAHTDADTSVGDDMGFGAIHAPDRGQTAGTHQRAQLAPDVYHTDAPETDPFPPLPYDDARRIPDSSFMADDRDEDSTDVSSILTSAFRVFLQSDTGKVLMAQATAVLMGYAAKKFADYIPILKNSDLASSRTGHQAEPETKDIEFTYHHDDADAPHHPL